MCVYLVYVRGGQKMSSGAELGARPGRELAAELARRWWGKRGGRSPWHEEARHGTAPLAGEAQSNMPRAITFVYDTFGGN